MKYAALTQDALDRVFACYRKALHSHYPAPRLAVVQKELDTLGSYEYRTGPAKVWQAVLVFTKEDDGVEVTFGHDINEQFRHMEPDILQMKKKFETLLEETP